MPESFYLIDGHAQIFRSYFAPFRDLTSPTGEPTKATFVFAQMLLNLIETREPAYLAMVIDQGGDEKVFRREIFPAYKANRPPKPADFAPQEKRILELVKATGIPIFGKAGFEADDVIATITHRLRDMGFDVFLVSKDKDLRQLLGPGVRMLDAQSGAELTAERLKAEYGYSPEQAVEIQTLMGDAVDNVPGIPGVGEKTAAKLIGQYGDVAGVVANADALTPKLRENVLKHAGELGMSRQLVTLRKDVEMAFDPASCRFAGIDPATVRPMFDELGFGQLLKRVGFLASRRRGVDVAAGTASLLGPTAKAKKPDPQGSLFAGFDEPASAGAAVPPAEGESAGGLFAGVPTEETGKSNDYRLVNTEAELAALVAAASGQRRIAVDTETDALGAMASNLVGISISWAAGTGWYVPVKGPAGEFVLGARAVEALKPVLEDARIEKVGHNIKYDLLVLRNAGVTLRGIVMDSMIGAFLLDASRLEYGIDTLALQLLQFRKVATGELIGRGRGLRTMADVPLADIARYAGEDADIALRLAALVDEKLAGVPEIRRLADEVEMPLIQVLAEMEWNGVSIDEGILAEQSEVLGKRCVELHAKVMEAAGTEFNPDSPKQLAEVLFDRLKLKVVKKTKTGRSTDVEVLERLATEHPVPKLILEYRSLVKLKNTYLDNLTEFVNRRTGRIHATFKQTGAATGRLSCNDPNMQNIPIRTDEGRRIRLAFVPGDRERDVLLTADYSQIELRVLAHFTGEPALVAAFEADQDVHAAVAAEVFGTSVDAVSREQRAQAKIINFGIIYGITAMGLARRIDGMSVKGAQELIWAYNKRFPGIAKFMDQCVIDAQSQGYVTTILGRRRPINELGSGVLSIRNAGERMAINSVVQGSAADLIKVAMLNIQRRIEREGMRSRMLLQVHDELVFETPMEVVEREAEIIREEMAGAMKLRVPLKAEVGWGKNWQEGK